MSTDTQLRELIQRRRATGTSINSADITLFLKWAMELTTDESASVNDMRSALTDAYRIIERCVERSRQTKHEKELERQNRYQAEQIVKINSQLRAVTSKSNAQGKEVRSLQKQVAALFRSVPCPQCGVARGDMCLTSAGKSLARSHSARRRLLKFGKLGESHDGVVEQLKSDLSSAVHRAHESEQKSGAS